MKRISIAPQLRFRHDGNELALDKVLSLLTEVQAHGNLQAASQALGQSYRGAWGHIKEVESLMGAPLLTMARGRGAVLTPLAQRLLWGQKRLQARLGPLLETMASELQTELDDLLLEQSDQLRLFASHGLAVAALVDFAGRAGLPVDVSYRGSIEAIAALAKHECEVASFHVPIGALAEPVLDQYVPLLKGKSYRVADVASRRLGLLVARGNPLGIQSLADVPRTGARFANRERGSGTRIIFDLLLAREGIDPSTVAGAENIEFTHAAVAAYIASGRADTGLAIEAAASQFGLDFIPILTERYCLMFPESAGESPHLQSLLAILQSDAYRQAVHAIPGYSESATGRVTPLSEAFPSLG
ncbi:LysR family transcriptional regulator [Pandoraea captiosa]|uniref:LysR family transcriptional regulator n=1 Tax=Pandoraea captiosa TaxID=2508302 RepID=A0A5E4ZNZ3_9BURK|nr:substrate-binding domain-containing protein [Pandoraea captiosa]VVE62538.1 LysR family transcriptional regulator [Pandoraea captiosa]